MFNLKQRLFRNTLLLLIFLIPLSKSFASTTPLVEPQKVELGIFLTSLYDVNSTDGSFSADLWFWSKSKSHAKFDLQNVEVNYLSSKHPLT
jgi:hypothetical protein